MLVKNLLTPLTGAFCGIGFAFLLVLFLLKKAARFLPHDIGREFAHNGALSAGKPRGAGLLFVLAFVAAALLFLPFTVENLIYLLLLIAAMMTGYLDDGAKTPWGEYKKGLLDLIIAVVTAVTFLNFNEPTITLNIINTVVTLPKVVFGILIVVLVWTSINVTNCADGVDGLSATVTVITLLGFWAVMLAADTASLFRGMIPVFCAALAAYLCYNASPSKLLMGDAGSRAMGLFIALAALRSGSPLLYLLCALVLILDGGLGLLKVSLLRFLKIRILKNVRTPIHDHVRKNMGWSDPQTVMRFAVLQAACCVLALYFVLV